MALASGEAKIKMTTTMLHISYLLNSELLLTLLRTFVIGLQRAIVQAKAKLNVLPIVLI